MSERDPDLSPTPREDEPVEPVMPSSIPPDVPEADAIEQAAPLRARDDREPDTIGDAPEADAIEQLTDVADPDEDDRR
jgi:hypothetical protein